MQLEPVDTVAKYFFFSSLDEQVSFAASLKALSELKAGNWLAPEYRSRWIQILTSSRLNLKLMRGRPWPDFSQAPGFSMPEDFDLIAWSHFLTTADPAEVDAVLLSRILGFTDQEISDGLSITLGTVRYRLGRGLRHLGGYLES